MFCIKGFRVVVGGGSKRERVLALVGQRSVYIGLRIVGVRGRGSVAGAVGVGLGVSVGV